MAARRYGRAEGARTEERAPRWGRGLAPALVVPAVLAGATSAVLVHSAHVPERSGVVEQRSPRPLPRDLGATGQLPQQQRPAQQVLDHAGDPRALATGAGPPVPVPTGPQGIPQPALTAYIAAADRISDTRPGCGLDWSVLAAIGRSESGHARSGRVDAGGTTTRAVLGPPLDGRGVAAVPDSDGGALDGDPVWDRAVGPMQLLPSTWERYGGSASGAGPGSPHNLADAALATGRILCASGGDLRRPPDLAAAVFSYNHSDEYVRTVLVWAASYARGVTPTPVRQASADRDPLAGERVTAPPLQLEPPAGPWGWPVPVEPGQGQPGAGQPGQGQPGPEVPPQQVVPVEPGTPSPSAARPAEPAGPSGPAELWGPAGPSGPAASARPSEPVDPDLPGAPGTGESLPGWNPAGSEWPAGAADPPAAIDLGHQQAAHPGSPAHPADSPAPPADSPAQSGGASRPQPEQPGVDRTEPLAIGSPQRPEVPDLEPPQVEAPHVEAPQVEPPQLPSGPERVPGQLSCDDPFAPGKPLHPAIPDPAADLPEQRADTADHPGPQGCGSPRTEPPPR